jgi:hypothetical protein
MTAEIIDITPYLKRQKRLNIVNEPKTFQVKPRRRRIFSEYPKTVNLQTLHNEVLFNVLHKRGDIENLFYFYEMLGTYLSQIMQDVPGHKQEIQIKDLSAAFKNWATIFYRDEKKMSFIDESILKEMVEDDSISFAEMIRNVVNLILDIDKKSK